MRLSLSLLGSLIVAASLPIAAHADTLSYNPVTTFSTTGSTAPFSYGYSTPGSGGFTLDTGSGVYGTYPYVTAGGQFLPVVGLGNNGPANASVDVPAGMLWMHPGNSLTQASIVQFTAPTSGSYNLTGLFQRDDTVNGAYYGVDVYIYVDQTGTPIYSAYIPSTAYGTDATFDQNVTLTAGQTLDFEVGENSAVSSPVYYNDSTGFEATITPSATPEPSSMLLLGTGLLAVAALGRRKLFHA